MKEEKKENRCNSLAWKVLDIAIMATIPVVAGFRFAKNAGETIIYIADCLIHNDDTL
ncbi:hypothetical protein JW758_04365 [Candidatus Peregrinibacteria bacterium]|nr:hypothetical protein [Candidatus Peregrinibacteria bacterium]